MDVNVRILINSTQDFCQCSPFSHLQFNTRTRFEHSRFSPPRPSTHASGREAALEHRVIRSRDAKHGHKRSERETLADLRLTMPLSGRRAGTGVIAPLPIFRFRKDP